MKLAELIKANTRRGFPKTANELLRPYIELGEIIARDQGMCTGRISPTPEGAGYSGIAHRDGTIESPWPTRSESDLQTLAHEIGHINLGHLTGERLPRWKEEYEAEKYARKILRKYGVKVDKHMMESAREYVAQELSKAAIAGHDLSDVPLHVRKWAKWGVEA